MLLAKDKKQFVNVAFDNEDELEKVVLENAELLFGDMSVVLPKKKITTLDGAGTIPDGVVIDLRSKRWLILEAELAHHGTWTHIAPQVAKQLTAMANPVSKEMLMNLTRDLISDDRELLERIEEELGITPIRLHVYLQEIFNSQPDVAIPIDDIPKDLLQWADGQKAVVKTWKLQKYINVDTGEILYEIPDNAIPTTDTRTASQNRANYNAITRTPSESYQQMFAEGLLSEGEELSMKYGPKSGEKTTFTGIARINGVELDGQVYSPSTAALLCIQKINPDRPSVNGWLAWKNSEGETLDQLSLKLMSQ